MFISCSKDDSVQEPVFEKNELVQTTWSGCQYFYNDKDEIKETIEDFKVDFQNANEAIYIDSVGYSYFRLQAGQSANMVFRRNTWILDTC